jgi:hypothetical protein
MLYRDLIVLYFRESYGKHEYNLSAKRRFVNIKAADTCESLYYKELWYCDGFDQHMAGRWRGEQLLA